MRSGDRLRGLSQHPGFATALAGAASVRAQDVGFANAWPELTPHDRDAVMKYADDFKTFLGKAKSEMAFVREATRVAEANGFRRQNLLHTVHFAQMNLFKPVFQESSFDLVICNGVLHHTSDPRGEYIAGWTVSEAAGSPGGTANFDHPGPLPTGIGLVAARSRALHARPYQVS